MLTAEYLICILYQLQTCGIKLETNNTCHVTLYLRLAFRVSLNHLMAVVPQTATLRDHKGVMCMFL